VALHRPSRAFLIGRRLVGMHRRREGQAAGVNGARLESGRGKTVTLGHVRGLVDCGRR
jgi:hypothetical protein